jgi:hypothetical protein
VLTPVLVPVLALDGSIASRPPPESAKRARRVEGVDAQPTRLLASRTEPNRFRCRAGSGSFGFGGSGSGRRFPFGGGPAFQGARGMCGILNLDVNGDGDVNGQDPDA